MAEETYYRLVINPQPRVKPANIDYYMSKNTSEDSSIIREIYPDRVITRSIEYDLSEIPFLFYDITLEEYEKLKKNPDILSIEELPTSSIFPLFPIQTSTFTTNPRWNYEGSFSASIFDNTCPAINWGLYWHTQYKTNVDWLKSNSLTSSFTPQNYEFYNEDYTYNLDGDGVDLIIMDTGIDYNHPEFLDENGDSRVVLYRWWELVEDLLPSFYPSSNPSLSSSLNNIISNYYNTAFIDIHGTCVASVAAGRLNGWAKKATLYSLRISGPGYGGFNETINYKIIKRFHESKPIDPITGVKKPTIVNMSFGSWVDTLRKRKIGGEDELTPTGLQDFMYKGTISLSSSLGWSGDDNMPGLEHQMRLQNSESYDSNIAFLCPACLEVDSLNTLIQECLDVGVIMIAAAGNQSGIMAREGDSSIYNSYAVPFSGSNDLWLFLSFPGREKWKYHNRVGTPASPPGVIYVGALSPNLVIPKSPITNSLSPSFGSIQYDIFGPVRWWGVKNRFNIPSDSASYDHGDVLNWTLPPDNPGSKLGYGKGEPFPGWEYAYNSASLAIAGFTQTGPAVEIFAAGENIACAIPLSTPSFIKSLVYSRPYSLYNPVYEGTGWEMGIIDGTSFASPQVAGVACLYFQMNPQANVNDFRNFLNKYAPTDARLNMFDEDPQHRAEFSGSLLANKPYNANKNIGLFGASTKILHWPFTKATPLTIT
jgi:subtilisin family serine protease